MKQALIAIVFLLLIPQSAQSEIRLDRYQEIKDTDKMLLYMTGIGVGFGWSNTMLEDIGKEPLCCPPSSLALNYENYQQLIEKELSRTTYPQDTPIAMVLLIALQSNLPCE